MSNLGKTLKSYNILDIINSDSSRKYLENFTDYIKNIDKDVILLLIDSGRQV